MWDFLLLGKPEVGSVREVRLFGVLVFILFYLGVFPVSFLLRGCLGRVEKVFLSLCERACFVLGEFGFRCVM